LAGAVVVLVEVVVDWSGGVVCAATGDAMTRAASVAMRSFMAFLLCALWWCSFERQLQQYASTAVKLHSTRGERLRTKQRLMRLALSRSMEETHERP
jgi:hypothetical protein